jgi:hypothetical protein
VTHPTPLSIGEVAVRLSRPGCQVHPWHIRRVIARGLLEEPARFGPNRLFFPDQLPQVENALRLGGYLPTAGEGDTSAA